MRLAPIRFAALALMAAALLAAGCAKKTTPVQTAPVPPSTTPAPTPSTPAPVPTPPAPSTPAASISDLATVHFALDSSALDDAARAILDRNARLLRDNADWTVTIAGNCDERGTVEYNQALGERRALAVRDYLIAAGVPDSRLKTISYGKEMPVDDGHDEAAWAKNRRADFSR
ncbi:MAG: peptidoglycan-associated lipoprotein Pal [Candidatus Eisenbacteria bacterium]|nr:peptidoglycan-associated lipoprotein Pal [Candidatus Eisenbacteria bacterium]